jgi:integrase
VPLTGKLEAALRRIKHLRSDRVFCNPDGSVLTLDQLHERFWMVSPRAGLRRLRWHDLRYSFGSQEAMAGVPIIQVQQWMGHSTINMTINVRLEAVGHWTYFSVRDERDNGTIIDFLQLPRSPGDDHVATPNCLRRRRAKSPFQQPSHRGGRRGCQRPLTMP